MDYSGIPRESIRARALEKLALLSAKAASKNDSMEKAVTPTLKRLLNGTKDYSNLAGATISTGELEVLIALCRSSPQIKNQTQAQILLNRFSNYLNESKDQKFAFPRLMNAAPWTKLTYELVLAISTLGLNFTELKPKVQDLLSTFISTFSQSKFTLPSYFSLIGLLQGLTDKVSILNIPLFKSLVSIFNDGFYSNVEVSLSKVLANNDVEILENFQDYNAEFSSLFFMFLVGKLSSTFLAMLLGGSPDENLIQCMLRSGDNIKGFSTSEKEFLVLLYNMSLKNLSYVSTSPDRVTASSHSRLSAVYLVKASSLEIITLAYSNEIVPITDFRATIDTYMDMISKFDRNSDIVEIVNSELLQSIFAASAILSKRDNAVGYHLNRVFPSILSIPLLDTKSVKLLTSSVIYSLKQLSQDDVVSAIYVLTNILSDPKEHIRYDKGIDARSDAASGLDSACDSAFIEARPIVCRNVVSAVSEITKSFNNDSINNLVVTILSQKIKKTADESNLTLLEGLINFIDIMKEREFLSLLRNLYDIVLNCKNNQADLNRVVTVWLQLSERLCAERQHKWYLPYLNSLLSYIISQGDSEDSQHHRSNSVVTNTASKIEIYLKPLAALLPPVDLPSFITTDKETVDLFKDTWYNLCCHGFAYDSRLTQANYDALLRIAHSSPALASESSWNRSETSIDLNTVLRRGTSKHTEKLHKDTLSNILTSKSIDAKVFESQISKPKLIFLSANLLLESLRVDSGDCSNSLDYLSDPSIAISDLQSYVGSIAYFCCSNYVRHVQNGGSSSFTISKISQQLKNIFVYCCHRDFVLQSTAFQCADLIIMCIPSVLCHEEGIFPLLDILTLLFESVIDADTNEYEPQIVFTSEVSGVKLVLSDSHKWRQSTLNQFSTHSRQWITQCQLKSRLDTKSILRSYVSKTDSSSDSVNYGSSFALEMAGKVMPSDKELYTLAPTIANRINLTSGLLTEFPWKKESIGVSGRFAQINVDNALTVSSKTKIATLKNQLYNNTKVPLAEFEPVVQSASVAIIVNEDGLGDLVKDVVSLPFITMNDDEMEVSIRYWLNIMRERPSVASLLLSEVLLQFELSVKLQRGLFTRKFDLKDSKFHAMEYVPTSQEEMNHHGRSAASNIKPHLLLIRLFASHFEASKYQSDHILKSFTRTVYVALKGLSYASLHPYARLARFELVSFALGVMKLHSSLKSKDTGRLSSALLDGSLTWFTKPYTTPYGNNKLKIKTDHAVLEQVAKDIVATKFTEPVLEKKRGILLLFLDHEISFLDSWLTPLDPHETLGRYALYKLDEKVLTDAYNIDGRLALNLVNRYQATSLNKALKNLVYFAPANLFHEPDAVQYAIPEGTRATSKVVLWATAAPVDAIKYFLPPFNKDPLVLQFAMRSLESYDPHLTFFYVPQIVQALRYDNDMGYVRNFILETANVSQLFAHQIIWNMSANSYKDEDSTIPDDIKPVLDEIRETMVGRFSEADRIYYEKEFEFFNNVTDISGKLKPYIKKTKPEKKAKIDEEMAKIKVEPGVYLPSNPDGIVLDIDRRSGKPLQSHAKAPFMATFKIQKDVSHFVHDQEFKITETVNLSAIFKVGDDCRQDVLVLQIISLFRTIWMNSGVDVFVFPNRVTATAPGCGIIDVLPNSISRDMLGREAVNGLYEYFITQYGPETSSEFQKAKKNFVKSLAAYSVISYILQLKDRHNGNLMYDKDGHILHIDFGFCFDIVPGGFKFEQSPFKLSTEMVRVMGGSIDSQAYRWFEELCIKSYLAVRPYMELIIGVVNPMLDSGLPCFKGQTIKNLRGRFAPEKSERDAARHFRALIKRSYESYTTRGYDEFQRLTNGIPY